MKEKNLLLYTFIFFILINKIYPQDTQIDPNVKGNQKETLEKKGKEKENEPIIETKELKDDEGNNITITRIIYNRTSNLNSYSGGITPFHIIRVFDDRINSIFDDFIRQSIGIKMLLNGFSKIVDDDDNDEDEYEYENVTIGNLTSLQKIDLEKEFFEDDDDEETGKNKSDSMNNTMRSGNYNSTKRIRKYLKRVKNYNRTATLKANLENFKGKLKKKKKLNRRELIFSRVCKYIFYLIILFVLYILIKKLLEIFEIIDPDNASVGKVENDELTNLKKTSGTKIS